MSAERGPREGVSAQGTIPLPRYCSPWGILAAILSAFWGFDNFRPIAQWAVEGLPTEADEESRVYWQNVPLESATDPFGRRNMVLRKWNKVYHRSDPRNATQLLLVEKLMPGNQGDSR